MKTLMSFILALAALAPAQVVYDGGRTSIVDTVRWGDADDSTHSLLVRKASKFRDSAGTWRALVGIDSCSKPIRISNGTTYPEYKPELSYDTRTSAGNTDSSQIKLKMDSRYCWSNTDTSKCDAWVPAGRYQGDTASIVIDSLITVATSLGTTWTHSRQLFDIPGGTHIRFCVDGYKTGAQANDSTFFRRFVVRTSAVRAGGTPPASVTVSGGSIATSTNQTNGAQKSQIVDGSGNVVGSTSNALDVNIKSGASSGAVAQGSTTSGQTGGLMQAAVTNAAPTYTTGQTNPLSLTTDGALRVDASGQTLTVGSHAVTNAGTFATQAAQAGTWTVQPGNTANTTAWLVTGTGGTFPVSFSTTGSGTATGALRVELPTNGTGLVTTNPATAANWGVGAIGSAFPANAVGLGANSGGNMTGLIQTENSVKIDVSTATTTQLVALASSKKIYVTSWDVVAAGTGTIKLVYGTGSSCGTGTTDLTGAYSLVAQAGLAKGNGLGAVLVVPASNALCVTTSAAVGMQGSLSYTQF